jgi:hypothetical protein
MTRNPQTIITPTGNKPKFAQEARVKTINGLVPLRNIEQVEGRIWRGEVMRDTAQHENLGEILYFDRQYDKETNEGDKYYEEFEISAHDDLYPYTWYLVPKEKCLFVYEAPSHILKAPANFAKPQRRQ